MKGMQRRVGNTAVGMGGREPELIGFPVKPIQLLTGCALFVLTVILMNFFIKFGGKS